MDQAYVLYGTGGNSDIQVVKSGEGEFTLRAAGSGVSFLTLRMSGGHVEALPQVPVSIEEDRLVFEGVTA